MKKKYTIIFENSSGDWLMDGQYGRTLGIQLIWIAHENNIQIEPYYESEILKDIRAAGIEVEIVDSYDKELDY